MVIGRCVGTCCCHHHCDNTRTWVRNLQLHNLFYCRLKKALFLAVDSEKGGVGGWMASPGVRTYVRVFRVAYVCVVCVRVRACCFGLFFLWMPFCRSGDSWRKKNPLTHRRKMAAPKIFQNC